MNGTALQVRCTVPQLLSPQISLRGVDAGSQAELRRFLYIAMGSTCELEYHLLLAHDLKFLSVDDYDRLITQITEIKRMLAGFIKSIN